MTKIIDDRAAEETGDGYEDMYDGEITPDREHTRKIMMFAYVKDTGIDPKTYFDADELVEYREWLKMDRD